jgi:hypothetical protein
LTYCELNVYTVTSWLRIRGLIVLIRLLSVTLHGYLPGFYCRVTLPDMFIPVYGYLFGICHVD